MIYCGGFYPDTMYMRDCIIIKNGLEPYTLSWECPLKLARILVFKNSNILNETTTSNPYFRLAQRERCGTADVLSTSDLSFLAIAKLMIHLFPLKLMFLSIVMIND